MTNEMCVQLKIFKGTTGPPLTILGERKCKKHERKEINYIEDSTGKYTFLILDQTIERNDVQVHGNYCVVIMKNANNSGINLRISFPIVSTGSNELDIFQAIHTF